jgi:lipoate-protein ligase B
MSDSPFPALEAFLLGTVDFDVTLGLQQRLVEQAHERGDGQVTLLLCEHPTVITIGRGGSPAEVATESTPVKTRQIAVRWVNRGGGALLHCPGQLAIYPIVPLRWHGFSVGEFLDRFQAGLSQALDDLNVPCRTGILPVSDACRTEELVGDAHPTRYGIFGRTGQLAAFGLSVRHWITYYGAYLNVCPAMGWFRLVENDVARDVGCVLARTPSLAQARTRGCKHPPHQTMSAGRTQMSSLLAECCGSIRMTAVRAALVRRLADSFGCDRYHLYTGHPMLRRERTTNGAKA